MADSAAAQQQQPVRQQVNLDTLSIDQLQRLRKQVDEEMNMLKSNVQTLGSALERFNVSLGTVQRLKEGESELMIPVSSSMYMRGKTNANDKVTIDLGTGISAKVSNEEGQAILKRKIDYVLKNRKAFQEDLKKKMMIADNITSVLQKRIQEQTAMLEATGLSKGPSTS